ncbi:hypothetical protein UK23_33225 [Lentzea aerocolonigenes]|uniref:Uncharacterized protein n=1 Tax=Lentzea aerocolonigenes TaxID=68170 RepID=A0A0F0GPT9_LENAE|nr:hypothetical protein [Lentzea aerocolonigenes]KJK43433.1 hypothetical protein UK23_33225 [Lentzea aerocolonigenes]
MTEYYAIVADNVPVAPIGLARRTEAGDEAYHRDHGWRPTKVITRYFEADADDALVPITEQEADELRTWFHHRQGDPPLIGGPLRVAWSATFTGTSAPGEALGIDHGVARHNDNSSRVALVLFHPRPDRWVVELQYLGQPPTDTAQVRAEVVSANLGLHLERER